jgi:hypothetical protein
VANTLVVDESAAQALESLLEQAHRPDPDQQDPTEGN